MKYLILLYALCISINTAALFTQTSLGIGTFTEHVGKIADDIDGNLNYFELNPYLRASGTIPFYFDHDLTFEFSISVPSSSRDSDVTKINYWTNFLFENHFKYIDLQYGVGFYMTRLSMDGTPQESENANEPTIFQTPNGAIYTFNNVIVFGPNIHITNDMYLNIQAMVLNIDDSVERSFNYSISLNQKFGEL